MRQSPPKIEVGADRDEAGRNEWHFMSVLQIAVENVYVPAETQFLEWLQGIEPYAAVTPDSLTIRIVDAEESQTLNRQFRGKDKPTNVLSFPSQVPDFVEQDYLGDLAICASVVAKEAAEQHKSEDAHWAHMLVHGVLHLHGYDHIEQDEAEQMESLETRILTAMGLPAPYAD